MRIYIFFKFKGFIDLLDLSRWRVDSVDREDLGVSPAWESHGMHPGINGSLPEVGGGGGGGGTPYNGLYGEAPPERGTLFRLEVHKRVRIARAEV